FLDLDNATAESDWTATLAHALQTELSNIGNARVVLANNGGDVKMAAREFRTRTALFGTRRKTDRGIQISVQLFDPEGKSLFGRTVDVGATSDFKPLTHNLAPALYSVMAANDWSNLIAAKSDPAMRNEQARELITAGRELNFHYTARDFDRAISCFEKALKLEPRSALAHAYAAGSAAGRTHYVADANLLFYAEHEAQEALRLAPDSGEVLRVLAGVNYQRGQFGKALDKGLHAIETSRPDGKSAGLLGMVYKELGRPDQALRWFALAKRSDSRPGEYDCHIGDCWTALGNDEKARTAYGQSIDLHPERSQGWICTARLHLRNAEF